MGLTQIKKGKKQHLLILSLSQDNSQKPKNIKKKLLIIMFIPLVSIGIYLSVKIPKIKDKIPTSIASPVTSPSPFITAFTPQTDTFREAVNKAISAAKLTQLAKSPDEWKTVVSHW